MYVNSQNGLPTLCNAYLTTTYIPENPVKHSTCHFYSARKQIASMTLEKLLNIVCDATWENDTCRGNPILSKKAKEIQNSRQFWVLRNIKWPYLVSFDLIEMQFAPLNFSNNFLSDLGKINFWPPPPDRSVSHIASHTCTIYPKNLRTLRT